MIILGLSNYAHDHAVVVADDYRVLAAVQRERTSRIKGAGAFIDGGLADAAVVAEATSS